MECKQADKFIMQYAEELIKPSDAKELAKHLLECENCRIAFTVFGICLEDMEIIEAPANFTEKVMEKIREEKRESDVIPFGFRVFWGLTAIIAGVALLLVFNTTVFFNYTTERLESLNGTLHPFFENISASLGQIEHFGIITFLFVPLLGTLLYVLHSGDKSVEA